MDTTICLLFECCVERLGNALCLPLASATGLLICEA